MRDTCMCAALRVCGWLHHSQLSFFLQAQKKISFPVSANKFLTPQTKGFSYHSTLRRDYSTLNGGAT